MSVTGSYTFNKVSNAFTPNGGLGNRTVTIGLTGTTTLTQEWSSIISAAANDWNTSGAGVNITTTTLGPQQHIITVDWFSSTLVPGVGHCGKSPSGNVVATSSIIRINLNHISADTLPRRSTVAHEMAHLLWLGDKPYETEANISLMNYNRNRTTIFEPQTYDINNVRWVYS